MGHNDAATWDVAESTELYEVDRWGAGYFSISPDGNLLVHPTQQPDRSIDLKRLVELLRLRGIAPPVLLRFNDIIRHRLETLSGAFQNAIREYEYQGNYRCVYPIKVNQQRQIVEKIIRFGRAHGFGLEAGSKPELLAVVAMTDSRTPIVCNGFKDREFIEMALLTQKLGRLVIPVVERFQELELILQCARQLGVRPHIGMRMKLAARGSGRWQGSGGYRSKFGLTASELLQGAEVLRAHDMLDCLELLHFHLGSQITNIRRIKGAIMEAARAYADLARRGAGLNFLDVGGGLGVDYDGSQTNFESSINYTLQEYANDVVHHIQAVCNQVGIPHPDIVSESGRAVVAYHSVLVFDVLGVSDQRSHVDPPELSADAVPALRDLAETFSHLSARNARESFHDAQAALDMAIHSFSSGHLSLEQRSQAETLYWAICRKIRQLLGDDEELPEELQGIDALLADIYFCNFSLFQSLPDSWAIKQLFPVMPIHRLDEKPTRHAVLGDITCDSDGKLDRFIDRRDVRRSLPLHQWNSEPYYLGAFLLGAYQEILGDLHNLFGDTHAVHISLNDNNEPVLETIIRGDTVSEVLDYVQFQRDELIRRVERSVETAVRKGLIDHEQAGRFASIYESGLRGYTYLTNHQHDAPRPQIDLGLRDANC